MWQRFTESARKVVFYAQEEAGALGENYVSTEHFLLALTREGSTHVAAQMLMRQNLTLEAVYSTVKRQLAAGDANSGQDMQLTPRAKRVVDLAFDEAKAITDNYIGTEHLLLGLIREGEGLAGRVLLSLGVTLDSSRAALKVLRDENAAGKNEGKPAPSENAAIRPVQIPTNGDFGTLLSHSGASTIEIADSLETLVRLATILVVKDDFGYRELRDAGQFFAAPVGTTLKLLELSDRNAFFRVRVWDGDHAGKAGWIMAESFQRTGPDERPFPPEESPHP